MTASARQVRFSYATEDDPRLKRLLIRAIETMTGQPYLKQLYEEQRAKVQPGESFWAAAVRHLELKLDVNRDALMRLPKAGALVIVVLHDLSIAARHASRVVLLSEGRIVKSGGRELALELEEKGYEWVLDADVSSGEMDDGDYLVFVELERTKKLPEQVSPDDTVQILNQDDLTFTKESRPIRTFISIERSMYQTISEEMLKVMSSINEFANLIGEKHITGIDRLTCWSQNSPRINK